MNDDEFSKIWTALDNRITAINDRTKAHTIQIKELEKKIKNIDPNTIKTKIIDL